MAASNSHPMRTLVPAGWWPLSPFLALLAGCGEIHVRSIRPDPGVPEMLQGEWTGSWASTRRSDSGSLSVRVLEFANQPVVSLTIDNPCIVPRDYELRFSGGIIELWADGDRVLEASLEPSRVLVGGYQCAQDEGTWSATWQRELPPPLDLSGAWEGSVTVPGVASEPMRVELTQSVRSGALVLRGTVALPTALPLPVPITGFVNFGDTDFQLVMQTQTGFQPAVVMTGIGDRDPVQVQLGLLQVLSTAALPFSQGLFEMMPAAQ